MRGCDIGIGQPFLQFSSARYYFFISDPMQLMSLFSCLPTRYVSRESGFPFSQLALLCSRYPCTGAYAREGRKRSQLKKIEISPFNPLQLYREPPTDLVPFDLLESYLVNNKMVEIEGLEGNNSNKSFDARTSKSIIGKRTKLVSYL